MSHRDDFLRYGGRVGIGSGRSALIEETPFMPDSDIASCPRCKGSIYRVPRRMVDRILSLFVPVHRYRCSVMGCDWEGNLRVRPRIRRSRRDGASEGSDDAGGGAR